MNKSSQQNLASLKRHVLFVTFLCYIPHITTEPAWLFTIFLAAAGYRLIADYYNYPLLPRWVRFLLVIGCLFLLNGGVHSSQFVISFLLIFIILKTIEMQTIRDIKVIVLCNFLLMFSALIVIQELWTILYLLVAIVANLSILLKISAPVISLKQISSNTSWQLVIVIPLSIILFYVFPRIDPLWQVPAQSKGNVGLSETLNFGSIEDLYNDDSTVMQITFKNSPILNGYWRAMVLSTYTGDSWNSSPYNLLSFIPLQELKANESADYAVLVEPHQAKWLFYVGYPVAGGPSLAFSSDHGLITQNKEAIAERFAYSLKVLPEPYRVLTQNERTEALQLPGNLNPRLKKWAREQFVQSHYDVNAFIVFLRDYIHEEPFWYTLSPPPLDADRNQMDRFWFDTQKGFCEHYASAVTFILRAAGIPARVVVGYQGGQWNPIANAILIQQNDAHAWLEYWQQSVGWQRLDPTSFIASSRIQDTIQSREIDLLNLQKFFDISALPLGRKIKFFFQSIRFFSERWFLYYNQTTQHNLLQNFGLGNWTTEELLQASIGCLIVFFILLGLGYQWQQRMQDALLLEYHLLQKEFRRFNISISPAATLKQQCESLIAKLPGLAPMLSSFIERYEQLRLMQAKENKKETIVLFKALRRSLRFKKNP